MLLNVLVGRGWPTLCRFGASQAVARGGVTAAAVIHQPSYEIFEMFDDLMMLGKGGRTVYYGPQGGVQVRYRGRAGP